MAFLDDKGAVLMVLSKSGDLQLAGKLKVIKHKTREKFVHEKQYEN